MARPKRFWLISAVVVLVAVFVVLAVVRRDVSLFVSKPEATVAQTESPGPCPKVPIPYRDENGNPKSYALAPFQNPPDAASSVSADGSTRKLDQPLVAMYTDPDKTSIADCKVRLRTYSGALVGPTLRVKPGEALEFTLENRLPYLDPMSEEAKAQVKQETDAAHLAVTPHDFNTTNLHFHGLHVSPDVPAHPTRPNQASDNVLLAVPGEEYQKYRLEIPKDHPPGTFWYHAHAHGSTAVQVGSGMSGAFIVEDGTNNTPPDALKQVSEKIMVFQTILYDENGKLENIGEGAFNQGEWQRSFRRTTINGQVVPKITMRPGEIQRWRMIDSSFRETLNLRLEGHDLHELALDGLYLPKVDTWKADQHVLLQAAYRSDVLVQASMTPGTYRLIDDASTPVFSILGVDEDASVVAEVEVKGDPVTTMKLPTDADMDKLAYLPPTHPENDLRKTAVGIQDIIFKVGRDLTNTKPFYYHINGQAFDPSRVRYLQKDTTDMWILRTVTEQPDLPEELSKPARNVPPHIFHIHVNPFQTVRSDPSGNSELVWKDTLLLLGANALKPDPGQPPPPPPLAPPQYLWTKYTDFTGRFVIHCHILDHEDFGMMIVVDVVENLPVPAERH